MIRKGSLSHIIGVVTVALVGSTLGCTSHVVAAKAPSPTFASETKPAEYEVPPEGAKSPRAELIASDGLADDAGARREFSQAASGLRQCPNTASVPVRIRIEENDEGRVRIRFAEAEPKLTFSSEGRRCILDAMSTIHVDDIASDGSPSNRPLGFTATVLLSW